MAAVGTGLLALVYVVGLTVYLAAAVQGAARVLNPVLTPAGLRLERHLVVGRRYRGMIDGRAVEITFLPAHGIAPALLNVTLGADLGTRMAVGRRRPQLDCTDCARVDAADSGLGELCVVAEDVERARHLLTDPGVSVALSGLLTGPGSGTREVYLQPERVWLRARPRGLTVDAFADWFDSLGALAEAAEALRIR
jgi:hypothetical protein